MITSLFGALLCAIELSGVTGTGLRARAFFDANNVKVGDPMTLTIDFLGEADFRSLHPPALARYADRRTWRLDDASAKTDTFRDARRLTYRVRPLREGVIWFPSLEFAYSDASGARRLVRSNEIPVHARNGTQIVVEGMDEQSDGLPEPPALATDVASCELTDDMRFAWRKACATPSAKAFAAFDFPEAKMNEARCAILDGNWAQAMKIYSRLEWRIGQTPEIERGIVAALARRFDNPHAELPVWRQVLRPILRLDWRGRLGTVIGGLVALALVGWLVGRGIRALACVAAILLATASPAQDIFRQMEEEMQRMHQRMQQSFGNFSFHFGEKEEQEPISVTASVAIDRKTVRVGEPFEFIISIEAPSSASLGQLRMTPSETFGLTVTGPAQNIADSPSKNPTNIVKRLSVPVRYDVPFRGEVSFTVEGMVSGRRTSRGGRMNFTFSNSFRCDTAPLTLNILPLPSAGQPADFAGVVSEGLAVFELPDILKVETNDVITITYRLRPKGYVPADFLPHGVAFEWSRQANREGQVQEIEYRRFFVADGAPMTPKLSIPYYDPRTKSYKTATVGGTPLKYVAPRETQADRRK
ncbi:MAG: hypothetical protein IKF72_00315 [Kiritimatiellae bacterium]|nr:hypothetical protein [Kiritimatiellia bacterium]